LRFAISEHSLEVERKDIEIAKLIEMNECMRKNEINITREMDNLKVVESDLKLNLDLYVDKTAQLEKNIISFHPQLQKLEALEKENLLLKESLE
jgi:hypothetical protein